MERGGRVHDPFEDTNLRHVKQIVGREMEEEWTYELSNYNIVPFYLLFFFFFFFIREWQPFKFRHKAPRLPPSPLYPAITTTVPLSTPVLKVHCDRNEGGKKIGQDRVSFPILFSLSFFLFSLNWSQLPTRTTRMIDEASNIGSRCYNYSYFSLVNRRSR